jgi:hypothetical protein
MQPFGSRAFLPYWIELGHCSASAFCKVTGMKIQVSQGRAENSRLSVVICHISGFLYSHFLFGWISKIFYWLNISIRIYVYVYICTLICFRLNDFLVCYDSRNWKEIYIALKMNFFSHMVYAKVEPGDHLQ